jgi:Uma2 family endonuclease
MTTEARLLTGEEFAAMTFDEPMELVEGRPVPLNWPKPRHGRTQVILSTALEVFASQARTGRPIANLGIYTRRNRDTVRYPDIGFVSYARLPRPLPDHYLEIGPELVVEIASPSNSWEGLRNKIDEYFAIEVEHVWVVEANRKTVLDFRAPLSFVELRPGDTLRGEGVLEGFEFPIEALFDW